jgi:hypothetical protein
VPSAKATGAAGVGSYIAPLRPHMRAMTWTGLNAWLNLKTRVLGQPLVVLPSLDSTQRYFQMGFHGREMCLYTYVGIGQCQWQENHKAPLCNSAQWSMALKAFLMSRYSRTTGCLALRWSSRKLCSLKSCCCMLWHLLNASCTSSRS